MLTARWCFGVLFLLLSVVSVEAGGKFALVIGNADYRHVGRLRNPQNDARDLSAALTRLGFDVTTELDLDQAAMRRALGRFNARAAGADMAVVYYAGHGIEIDKRNYLIPVDAQLGSDSAIPYEALPLELLTAAVSGARGLKLVILDACRNNPFLANMEITLATRSIGRGLARLEPAPGTLVAYAAREGTIADDGAGRNSPYTKALLDHVEQPGLEISFLFRRVRDAVMKETANRQQPFIYGSLPAEEIFLKAAPAATGDTVVPGSPEASARALELALWNEVRDLDDPVMLQIYVDAYPNGVFAAVARRRIASLRRRAGAEDAAAPDPKVGDQQVAAGTPMAPTASADAEARADDIAKSRSARGCDRMAAHPFDPQKRTAGVELIVLKRHAIEAVLVCQSAQSRFPDDLTIRFQLARALHAAERYDEAVSLYRAAANGGYSAAKLNLGTLYIDGNGVEADAARAIDLFRDAAASGNPSAMVSLGVVYLSGRGVETDYDEALGWMRPAAEAGHPLAQFNLGYMYQRGWGVPVDYAEAAKWYRLAANQGHRVGQSGLAFLYETGRGVETDLAEAARLYRRSAEQGHPFAQAKLAQFYGAGKGLAQDHRRAFEWARRAADQGESHGEALLGQMYIRGEGVEQDASKAFYWTKKAADNGNAEGQSRLGYLYANGIGVDKNMETAAHWHRKAAEQGDPYGQAMLAHFYMTGDGVAKDHRRALDWYRKSADQGFAPAMYGLSVLYEIGSNVPHDATASARWLLEAAKGGHDEALSDLGAQSGRLSRAVRIEVQRRLRESGYYDGALDGRLGPASRKAVARYLRS